MNSHTIKNKAIFALAAGMSIVGMSDARVEVMMRMPKKIVPCSEPLTACVEVHNTGTRTAPVDVMIEWPVTEFECSTVTRVAGDIEQTPEGVRWHGFSLKPGERMALGMRSMNMANRCTKRLTACATKCTARKTKIKPQELDIFMLDDECCDMPKVGPADPKADFVNVLAGRDIFINVLSNDGCITPVTIVDPPTLGTATAAPAAPFTVLYDQTVSVTNLPVTDSFNYEVCCPGSPEICSIVTVYVTIVDPNSFIGAVIQGCVVTTVT